MSLFGRLRWMALGARHRRRWERASAHLDGMLDEDEAAAFAETRQADAATREYSEDIQFIAQGLASLPQAEPARSFALTAEDIAAAEPPAEIRQPAPKSLRLAIAGGAAAIAAFAAVTAYDALDNRGETDFFLERAPVLQTEREEAQATTAMLADFDQSEQAEAALDEPPAPAVAAIEEAEDEVAASAEVAADEPESPSRDAEAIDWDYREEAQEAAEEEAATAPAARARFAAQRTESSASEAEPVAESAPAEAEEQAEDAALLAPAALEEDEEPAPAAPAQLEAAPEEDGDGELLMERGTEPVLLAETISAEDSGWAAPAQIALAIIAVLAAIAAIWIKIRQPRRPLA